MKLTNATTARLTLPSGKYDAIFWDDDLSGFGLRLRAGGTKVWVCQYRTDAGQRRETLGRADRISADEARKQAKRILAKVELGHDPAAEKREKKAKQALTLGTFVDRYLAFKQKKLRAKSYIEISRHLRRDAKPLHDRPVHNITRAHIAALIGALAETAGAATADRCRTTLSGFFTWLMTQGVLEANPVDRSTTFYTHRARSRTLDDDELKRVWEALPAVPDDYGSIVRLLMLTGQRRQEIGGLRWSEVDLERAVVRLPAERCKNHRAHEFPLSQPALGILRRVPRREGRDLVFGSDGQSGFTRWHVAKARLDERAKIAEPWTLHDLRRTCSTRMGDLGVQPHIIEVCLNHASGVRAGVSGTYNRSRYSAETRIAFDLWGERLLEIVEGRSSKVVALPFRA
jgi:integrase